METEEEEAVIIVERVCRQAECINAVHAVLVRGKQNNQLCRPCLIEAFGDEIVREAEAWAKGGGQ